MKYIQTMDDFAKRLTWARLQKELTQGDLAKLAGVSQSTIGNLEAGIRDTARRLPHIAAALGVDPLWLAEGDTVAGRRVRVTGGALPSGVQYDIITTEERKIIDAYRASTQMGREVIELAAERAERVLATNAPQYKSK